MRFRLIKGRDYSGSFDVYKDSNGKPFLRNSKKHISVTHFDGWTLVVVSKRPVGIDVQRMGKIDDLLWDSLDVRRGSKYQFFREWTRREAYIKKENLKLGQIFDLHAKSKFKTICFYPYVFSISY